MALFLYKVKNDSGRTLVGVTGAEDVKDVKRQINIPDHYFIAARAYDSRQLAHIKLKLNDLLMFNHRFSYLIDAGVPILQALRILWRQSEQPNVQIIVSYLYQELEGGATLQEAFGVFPKAFSPMYLALISVAEVGAGLSNVLKKISQYLEDQKQFQSRLQRATMYPCFVMGFALLVLIGLFIFVVPAFEKVILRLHGQLPWLTRTLFAASNLLRNPVFLSIVGFIILGVVLAWRYLGKKDNFKYWWDSWKLKMPVLKGVIYPLSVGRFTRSLGLLLGSGVSLSAALEVSKTTIVNMRLQKAAEEVRQYILDGGSLHDAFKSTKAFPFMVVEMIGIGESGGKLKQLLDNVSTHLEEEADYALNRFLTFLEPLMIIVVGGMVLMVLLGIYLPIFSLQSVLRNL